MITENSHEEYSVFISGETIDLCVPSRLAIERDEWADWFNNEKTTRFLLQGVYPNRIEDQLEFYDTLKEGRRFAVMIRPKGSSSVTGIISLSSINHIARSAQISLVINETYIGKLIALEAMARVTEHGFERMGLERIWAGQAFPGLATWNRMLELLGYRTEGVLRKGFIKGRNVSDSVLISCLFEDYVQIKELRDGHYWLGNAIMYRLVKALPKEGFADILSRLIEDAGKEYYAKLRYSESSTHIDMK